jgi:23S rRNA-intervening sequence protein
MQKNPSPELAVISKAYDLVLWSCRHLAKFPRSFRFTLGQRLETRLYDVLEKLLRAKYSRERQALLRDVNMDLELLRFQFRLARELKCLSLESYGFASRTINEVGQMVGGWLKASGGKTAA